MLPLDGSARVLSPAVVVTIADFPTVPLHPDDSEVNMPVVVSGGLPWAALKAHSVDVVFCHLSPLFIGEPAILLRQIQRHPMYRLGHAWCEVFTVRVHHPGTLAPRPPWDIPGHLVRVPVLIFSARTVVIRQATSGARTLGDVGDHDSRPRLAVETQ